MKPIDFQAETEKMSKSRSMRQRLRKAAVNEINARNKAERHYWERPACMSQRCKRVNSSVLSGRANVEVNVILGWPLLHAKTTSSFFFSSWVYCSESCLFAYSLVQIKWRIPSLQQLLISSQTFPDKNLSRKCLSGFSLLRRERRFLFCFCAHGG